MNKPEITLNDIGETGLIRRLTSGMIDRDDIRTGAGDDSAVVSVEGSPFDLLLTSDPVIEGTHFRKEDDPEQIGHKAVGRVLSDLAAMGGEAQWLLLDVVAPGSYSVERLDRVYKGATELGSRFGAAIVGGDTAEGKTLELHVFAVGRVPRGKAVLRSGARSGDMIYVTGALGGSDAGKHLAFEPRLKEGEWLGKQQWATSMIDISDGLATDMRHILKSSRLGAVIEISRIPIAEAAHIESGTPLERAFYDGEDFELLFTIPAVRQGEFEGAWRETFNLACTRIGVTNNEENMLTTMDERGNLKLLTGTAYEHFTDRTY